MTPRPYQQIDVKRHLPLDWRRGVLRVVRDHGFTSPAEDRAGLRIVSGEVAQEKLPWLWDLYAGRLRRFVEICIDAPVYVQNLTPAALTINVLSGADARYEWHVDTNPVTGILYLSEAQGGRLVFRGSSAYVRPRVGRFICFRTAGVEHRVTPLAGGIRISVPMNYFLSATDQERPADLDQQIYARTP